MRKVGVGNRLMTASPHACTRILVVEDDPAFRRTCAAAIGRDASLNVVASCSCARQAMVAISSASIDVALVDLGLPDGCGIDVIKAIRRRQPRCDVMAIGAFHDEAVVLRAIEAGASGYLLKDSAPSDIVASIRSVRAGGAPINPAIARMLLDHIRLFDAARRATGRPAAPPALSEREIEILRVMAKGLTLAEISRLFEISVNTVKTHVKRIYHKLAVNSRTEAIFEAQAMGLLRSTGGIDREFGNRCAGAIDTES
jgi:DNA-binding NarL/FixJ family response regulator